ncbi:MAG: ECF transporter S component [Candidatus Xenobia bacterium]
MLTTRQMTRGALMAALAVGLGLTQLGYIPVPTPARAITWVHVPVILSGILMGPMVGGIVGFIWGVGNFMTYQSAFPDPMVLVLPRILVGVVSAFAFRAVEALLPRHAARLTLGAGVAAVAGTLTNSAGVLLLAVWRRYLAPEAAWTVAAIHTPLELALAVVLTIPITVALHQRVS